MKRVLLLAVWVFFISNRVIAQNVVGKCVPASFGYTAPTDRESFSDNFGDYFEFKNVRYGVNTQGEGYIGVGEENLMVAKIPFRDLKGARVSLGPDELAIGRAVAYGSRYDRSVVCILSPFSGLGSSGSFQGTAGLIAVQKPHGGGRLKVEGAIVKVR